ncbi:MAG: ATP-binding protein [Synergistaceae bacterium]|nr:ATP-binding protein [Synergistaceae bacterium]
MSRVFATGTLASGSQIIGRTELIDRIAKYLYDDGKNVSLVGLPGSGKTSSACEALNRIAKRKDFDGRHTLLLKTSLGLYESFEEYWKGCVLELYDMASESGIIHHILDRERDIFASASSLPYGEVKAHTETFLKCLKKLGVRTIIFVDEFDAAVKLFGGARHYYEFFREAGSGERFSIRFLITSRLQIKRIETNAYGNSTLWAIFDEIGVHEFSDAEMEDYYTLLEEYVVPLTVEARQRIYQTAGRFPALLSLIGDRIVDMREQGTVPDVEKVIEQERDGILRIFSRVFKCLCDDKSAALVIQAAVGPRYKITPAEIQTLSEYMGYIFHEAKGFWTIISPEFLNYLRCQKLNVPIWPQLSEAQAALVRLVREKLTEHFGVDRHNLDDVLIAKKLIPATKIDQYISDRDNNRKKYGVESDLLDVLPIEGLANIISQYWPGIFSEYFKGKDYEGYWRPRFLELARARNPVAHAHPDYLTDEDIARVNAICIEIMECL